MVVALASTPSAYACNNEVLRGRETPLLKPKMKDEYLVSSLFRRRKEDKSDEGNRCPYCEFVNDDGVEQCAQCYYSIQLSARDQPMATPTTSGSDLMDTLLQANEAQDEEVAVEAVLSLDDVAVEIDQYETSASEQDDEFQFIGGGTPELAQTVEFEAPEEVELSASDAPSNPVVFDLGTRNPLDEVPEPVHTGLGNLYSPSVKVEKDEDLLGSVGPVKTPQPSTPELPNFNEPVQANTSPVETMPADQPAHITTPELPIVSDISTQNAAEGAHPVQATPSTPELPSVAEVAEIKTPELPSVAQQNMVASTPTQSTEAIPQTPEPTVQASTRFWPWPAKEAWGARQVYREVVALLESIKSGQLQKAAETLDGLGPHLDLNFEMLLHIGSAMRALNREEHLQWTLAMAKHVHPNNEHVMAAVAQLS